MYVSQDLFAVHLLAASSQKAIELISRKNYTVKSFRQSLTCFGYESKIGGAQFIDILRYPTAILMKRSRRERFLDMFIYRGVSKVNKLRSSPVLPSYFKPGLVSSVLSLTVLLLLYVKEDITNGYGYNVSQLTDE